MSQESSFQDRSEDTFILAQCSLFPTLLGSPGSQNLQSEKPNKSVFTKLENKEFISSKKISYFNPSFWLRWKYSKSPRRRGRGLGIFQPWSLSSCSECKSYHLATLKPTNPLFKNLDFHPSPCPSWVDGLAVKPHRAVVTSISIPRRLLSLGQGQITNPMCMGNTPNPPCPGPGPRKPGWKGRCWASPYTVLIEWSIIHPVPVPFTPCLGQADPVWQSTCCLVQKLL